MFNNAKSINIHLYMIESSVLLEGNEKSMSTWHESERKYFWINIFRRESRTDERVAFSEMFFEDFDNFSNLAF